VHWPCLPVPLVDVGKSGKRVNRGQPFQMDIGPGQVSQSCAKSKRAHGCFQDIVLLLKSNMLCPQLFQFLTASCSQSLQVHNVLWLC
jgi:hypothetical protein